MAVLPDGDRWEVWANAMRKWSETRDTIAVNKTDLRAAINAIDDWLEANKASYNSAIPQPARSGLTTVQKAMLLMWVVSRRYIAGV